MPRSVLLRLSLAAATAAAAIAPATAAASHVKLVTRPHGSAARVDVRAAGRPERVTLFLDGRRVSTDHRAPFAFRRLNTRALHRGTHRLRALVRYNRSRSVGYGLLPIGARGTVLHAGAPLAVALKGISQGQSVTGPVTLAATPQGGFGGAQRVEFWADGTRQSVDRQTPFTTTWSPTEGRHLVAAVAYDQLGMKAVSSFVTVIAAGAAATAPAPTVASDPAPAAPPANVIPSTPSVPAPPAAPATPAPTGDPLWSSTFDNGSALPTEWSFWGQGQESDYGKPQIVDPTAEGLPATGDNKVVKLYHAAGDPAHHHKLYKSFRANTWPNGAEPATQNSSPADVSGSYSCRLYVPSKNLQLGSSGWINMMQFKEDFSDPSGGFHSNPDYWFGMNNDLGHPSFDLNSWGMTHKATEIDARPYLDKWFTVEMRLYQHDRLEVYLDGKLIDTGLQSEFPVGRRYFVGQKDEDGNTIAQNKGWTLGVGDYVGTTEQESLVYVDGCSLHKLP